MNTSSADEDKRVESRLKEADVYYSMGLYEEALGVYEGIISDPTRPDPKIVETVKGKIASIKEDLHVQDKEPGVPALSMREKDILDSAMGSRENALSNLDKANAYLEQGLYKEALFDYKNLINADCPLDKVVPGIVQSILETETSDNLLDRLQDIIKEASINDQKKGELVSLLGSELQERGNKSGASALMNSLEELIKKSPEVEMIEVSSGPLLNFISADIFTPSPGGGKRVYHLGVHEQRNNLVELMVADSEAELLEDITKGDSLNEVMFYAHSAIRKMSVVVKYITEISKGPNKGSHVVGLVVGD